MPPTDDIPAGPELDAAVARAMGWRDYLDGTRLEHEAAGGYLTAGGLPRRVYAYGTSMVWRPSADTPNGYAAMRDCLAWLRKEGWRVVIKDRRSLGYLVILTKFDPPAKAVGVAPGLPEAVCRALLKTKEARCV